MNYTDTTENKHPTKKGVDVGQENVTTLKETYNRELSTPGQLPAASRTADMFPVLINNLLVLAPIFYAVCEVTF